MESTNSRTGFQTSTSTSANARLLGFNAFNNTKEAWVTATNLLTGWLQIKVPERVRIWRLALKARAILGRNITAWNLTASNDMVNFITL